MRSLILAPALLIAAVLAVLLATSASNRKAVVTASPTTPTEALQPQPTHEDGIRRVTAEELRAAMEQGKAVVVDVRGADAYKAAHIKGALSIPEGELKSRAGELPKDKLIVFYCAWPAEHSSARAAQTVKAKGLENVGALLGGYAAWEKAGFPVEKK